MASSYDAAKKTADLVPTEFVVSEKRFLVKRSGKALKKIISIGTDEEAEDPAFNIEQIYTGISFVLIDPTRDPETSEADADGVWHPKSSWLEDELDFMVAQDFMEKILPSRVEGNATSPSLTSSDSVD